MRQELQSIDRARSLPRALAQRARIILLAADGLNNTTIAQKLGLSGHTVGLWRRRFLSQGLARLYDEAKSGGPRSISDEQVAALICKTGRGRLLQNKPGFPEDLIPRALK